MQRFFVWILAHPRTVLLLLLIPTLLLGFSLRHLEKESDVTNMLPSRHETVLVSKEIEDTFGIKESFLVGVLHRYPSGIYEKEVLQTIHRVTQTLRGMPEVVEGSVKSLFDASACSPPWVFWSPCFSP
jgi:predicted RND superfamily exporter protein